MSMVPHHNNGFTAINSKLFERIIKYGFTSREIRIVLTVIRYTNGYHRKYAELSIRFLSEVTDIKYRHVQTTVKNLISKNILQINGLRGKRGAREICVNDDFNDWNMKAKSSNALNKEAAVADIVTSCNQKSNTNLDDEVNQRSNSSVTDSVNSSVHQKGDKDNKTLNKTLKKTITIPSQKATQLGKIKSIASKDETQIHSPPFIRGGSAFSGSQFSFTGIRNHLFLYGSG